MGGFVVFTHGQVGHGEEGVTYTVTGGPSAPGRGHQGKGPELGNHWLWTMSKNVRGDKVRQDHSGSCGSL